MRNWKQGQGEEWKGREQRAGGRGRSGHGQQKFGTRASIVMEAMGKQGGFGTGNANLTGCYRAEDGTLRMKIRVKKQDLKQILATGNLIIPPPPPPPHNNSSTCTNNSAIADADATSTYMSSRAPLPSSSSSPSPSPPSSSSSVERRLYDLKVMRRRRFRTNSVTHAHAIKGFMSSPSAFNWRPALQSIPEER